MTKKPVVTKTDDEKPRHLDPSRMTGVEFRINAAITKARDAGEAYAGVVEQLEAALAAAAAIGDKS